MTYYTISLKDFARMETLHVTGRGYCQVDNSLLKRRRLKIRYIIKNGELYMKCDRYSSKKNYKKFKKPIKRTVRFSECLSYCEYHPGCKQPLNESNDFIQENNDQACGDNIGIINIEEGNSQKIINNSQATKRRNLRRTRCKKRLGPSQTIALEVMQKIEDQLIIQNKILSQLLKKIDSTQAFDSELNDGRKSHLGCISSFLRKCFCLA